MAFQVRLKGELKVYTGTTGFACQFKTGIKSNMTDEDVAEAMGWNFIQHIGPLRIAKQKQVWAKLFPHFYADWVKWQSILERKAQMITLEKCPVCEAKHVDLIIIDCAHQGVEVEGHKRVWGNCTTHGEPMFFTVKKPETPANITPS